MKSAISLRLSVLAASAILTLSSTAAHAATVAQLKCEYLKNPLGIDTVKPRLSWVIESKQRGEKQTAYQILVATTEAVLDADKGDLWDSGKVDSDQSIQVTYAGSPLRSETACHWKVRVWGKDGAPSPWSASALWTMGLLEPGAWKAQWIGAPAPVSSVSPSTDSTQKEPSPIFRKAFAIKKTIASATVHVCGLGYYELYLNGQKVGDHVLDPAFTRYDKRMLYVTYDVTRSLVQGGNALGVMLGNGWFNMHARDEWNFDKAPWRAFPRLLLQLNIVYDDGSTDAIVTDSSWKTALGPVTLDCIRTGEFYDARVEKAGWNTASYADAEWQPAMVVDAPKGVLHAQQMPPVKVVDTIAPVKVTQPKPGVFVFDFGQNFSGWAQLRVTGPAGTRVTLNHGERLTADGLVGQENAVYVHSGQFQTSAYTLKGGDEELWEPRFTYYGFQYVQVEGFPGAPTVDNLRGRVVHTAFDSAGSFTCSNDLLNKIQRNILWSYLSNFMGYPTDCPQREKNGWTGDAHLAAEQGLFNFDSAAAYTKWLYDFDEALNESGDLPGIVPTSGWGYGTGPSWDSAYFLIPMDLYNYCGDTRALTDHYEGMKRYLAFLASKAEGHIVSVGLGDWVAPKTQTPPAVTSTAYYYVDSLIAAKTAALLGKTDDAKTYTDLAAQIKTAFNQKFYDATKALYAEGTQTALSCALYQDLAPASDRARIFGNLVANVETQNGHLDCGILGTKYLLHALTDNGRADLAYRVATQTTFPSWGQWLEQGATTLWENWDGKDSRNHIMFGDIGAWFYQSLAGIAPDPDKPGFKHIVIHPQVVGDLNAAQATHMTMYGKVRSAWAKRDGVFSLTITVPANTTATVFVPASSPDAVTESKTPIAQAPNVKFIRMDSGNAVSDVESGDYRFDAHTP